MARKPTLFLIDGHALAYRTYFALTAVGDGSRWTTKDGEPTAGTYGFASVLLRLMEQENPEYMAVSFDVGKTFRDDIYPEYKGTREKMPDDLRLQLERIRELVTAFNLPILEAEGFEADDVLGTIAGKATGEGVRVMILTGDRDLLQLAEKDVIIRLSGRTLSDAADFGPAEVVAKIGVRPDQMADYKGIVGDSSDNIPGVRGVGEKTAVKLLAEYDDLDTIYENLEDVQARFRNKLEEFKDDAYLSKKLALIVTDVDVAFDLEACRAGDFDRDKVVDLFRQLEFRTLLDRIPGGGGKVAEGQMDMFRKSGQPIAPDGIPDTVITVDEKNGLSKLVGALNNAKRIAFDVETTSTDAHTADLVGISLAVKPGEGYYLPVGHDPELAGGQQLPLEEILDAIRPSMTDPRIPKIGHNLKYDYLVLARYGLLATPLGFDTMLAEWLSDPASRNLGLKGLTWVRLGEEMIQIDSLIGSGRSQVTMAEVAIDRVAPYAAADAEVCLRLEKILKAELKEKEQTALFDEVEMPLIAILADMELAGIKVDIDVLKEISSELARLLEEYTAEIYDYAGHSFNINSTQQLSTVLFNEMELDPPDRARKTASGHYSTAASVLEEMRDDHPIVEKIIEQREVAKIKSTYADALQKQVSADDGRVHTSYNQAGSVTGRLASSDPNLQNIPIRSDMGRQIRRAFVADSGSVLCAVDYSQIELRILAHIAQDEAMIQAFLDDQDIHATTAAAVFGVELKDVTPDLRRQAKAVNFGLVYGMSAFGLTRSTDLTLAEAEDFVEAYFNEFPGVQDYLDKTKEQAAEMGYVETLLGRRRYFPQLTRSAKPVPEQVRRRAQREAINAPIQGTAADIIKLAMLELPRKLEETGSGARVLLQVHDELLFECSEKDLPESLALTREVMQSAFELVVPLKTEAKAGPNWYALELI